VTTDVVQGFQRKWQATGMSDATINRRCNMLRRAFRLGQRARKIHVAPYIPRLKEQSPRGRYITAAAAEVLAGALPAHLRAFFRFARLYGTRKGQLARTLRRFVDLDRGVVAWPPEECKHEEAHPVPLAGEGPALAAQLRPRLPLHCPYLFHGPRCAPGRPPHGTTAASATSSVHGRRPAAALSYRSDARRAASSSTTRATRRRLTSAPAG